MTFEQSSERRLTHCLSRVRHTAGCPSAAAMHSLFVVHESAEDCVLAGSVGRATSGSISASSCWSEVSMARSANRNSKPSAAAQIPQPTIFESDLANVMVAPGAGS